MEDLARSAFMESFYGDMGTIALMVVLFMAVAVYREFVVLPARRRGE